MSERNNTDSLGLERLSEIRGMIDMLDDQIAERLRLRFAYTAEAGDIKDGLDLPVLDQGREREILSRASAHETDGILPAESLVNIFNAIMHESRNVQGMRREDTAA